MITFLSPTPDTAAMRSPLPECDGVRTVDRSLARKWEIHGPASGRLGEATLGEDGTWTCPVTPDRTLVLGGDGVETVPAEAIDLTCNYAAVELFGPDVNERLARFCALDVRPRVMPVGAFRPGSVARTPGFVLRTGPDSLLLLVGWALGGYLHEVLARA